MHFVDIGKMCLSCEIFLSGSADQIYKQLKWNCKSWIYLKKNIEFHDLRSFWLLKKMSKLCRVLRPYIYNVCRQLFVNFVIYLFVNIWWYCRPTNKHFYVPHNLLLVSLSDYDDITLVVHPSAYQVVTS